MDTYKTRLRQYERRERLTTWFGAGYLTVTALLTTKVFELANPPALLTATLITFIVFGGGCLGYARVGFEWAGTLLRRKIEDATVTENDPLSPEDNEWPNRAERFWKTSILCLAAAGLVALFCAWWPVLAPVKKLKSMVQWPGLFAYFNIVNLAILIAVVCDETEKSDHDPVRQVPRKKWYSIRRLSILSFVLQLLGGAHWLIL
jgi:hypothetical protein